MKHPAELPHPQITQMAQINPELPEKSA